MKIVEDIQTMQPALHIKTQVLAGNKIEIHAPELSTGDTVEVFVILPTTPNKTRRSVIDLLNELPGQRLFKTAEEADKYLQGERDSWELRTPPGLGGQGGKKC